MAALSTQVIAAELRRIYPQVLAKALNLTRNLPDAEDAVHDAIERALKSWPSAGTPDSPEAWLVAVAANCYRDRLRSARREATREDVLSTLAEMSPWARIALADADVARGWKDELLMLLFACCHPALDSGESAALALATVIGLSTEEIARAFLVAPRTMEQRLTRARRRLRERGEYEGARPAQVAERLDAILCVIHLLFNEGYWSGDDEAPIRADLCRLGIGLARSLHDAFPDTPEVSGLLALLLLHEGRRPARVDGEGAPVPLPEQDRSRWDRIMIAEGTALLERALAQGAPGPFQTEAAISAVHCRAPTADATDWPEIAALYALLERMRPSPAVRVNRAFAVARAQGAATGLALLDGDDDTVAEYGYAHLVRGVLAGRAWTRRTEAVAALEQARRLARNRQEAVQIGRRIERLRRPATE